METLVVSRHEGLPNAQMTWLRFLCASKVFQRKLRGRRIRLHLPLRITGARGWRHVGVAGAEIPSSGRRRACPPAIRNARASHARPRHGGALASGRHFNRASEQVALSTFHEFPEGCLRMESSKILRQEVVVQHVHTDAGKPTEHRPNCHSCRPGLGARGLCRRTNRYNGTGQCHWQWSLHRS